MSWNLTNRDKLEFELVNALKWIEKCEGTGTKIFILEQETDSHSKLVIETAKKWQPKSEFPTRGFLNNDDFDFDSLFEYIKEVNPNVINHSEYRTNICDNAKRFFKRIHDELRIPVFVCSGNDSREHTVNHSSRLDTVITIASGYLDGYGEFKHNGYSDFSDDVDFIMFTLFGLEGTSFTDIGVACMTNMLCQHYGFRLTPKQAYDYWKNHCIDTGEIGFDDYHGYGLPVLPELNEEWKFDNMLNIKNRPCFATRITSIFGDITDRIAPHKGLDISPHNKTNELIIAVADGIVTASYLSGSGGNMVIIDHGDFITRSLHLNERKVQKGTSVKAGYIIGTMGTTGGSTGEHLHFDIYDIAKDKYVDPQPYIDLPYEERGAELTREETIELIKEMLEGKGSKPSTWDTKGEFKEAIELDITDGTDPQGMTTREETAIMIVRAIKFIRNLLKV